MLDIGPTYGKRARMTITRIGKKFCIALPIQVGIVSMVLLKLEAC